MPNLIDPIKVGKKIKELLKENKMTQENLANELLISKSAVSQNLNGRSTFDIQNLIKISQIFNISLDELLELSSTKLEELSIYEKLIEKDLGWFEETNIKQLVINEPDIYGKVFVEYIFEQNKINLFKYLDDNNLSFITDVNHRRKEVYLKTIIFMLENKLNPIKHIKKYVEANYTFNIEDKLLEEKIWFLIDQNNDLDLMEELINGYVIVNNKILFINSSKQIPILTLKDAFSIQAKYKLKNILWFLIAKIKEKNYYAYYDIVKEMIENKYYDGIITFNNNFFKNKKYSYSMKTLMKFSSAIELSIQTKNVNVIRSFLDNYIFTNIDKVVQLLIENELFDLAREIILNESFKLNYKVIGKTILKKQNNVLLDLIIKKSDQKTLNYLLSVANSDDMESIKMLLKFNAEFDFDNYNSKTFDKINNIIKNLTGKDK